MRRRGVRGEVFEVVALGEEVGEGGGVAERAAFFSQALGERADGLDEGLDPSGGADGGLDGVDDKAGVVALGMAVLAEAGLDPDAFEKSDRLGKLDKGAALPLLNLGGIGGSAQIAFFLADPLQFVPGLSLRLDGTLARLCWPGSRPGLGKRETLSPRTPSRSPFQSSNGLRRGARFLLDRSMLLCRDLKPGEGKHWYFAAPGVPTPDAPAEAGVPAPETQGSFLRDGFDPAARRLAQTRSYRDYLERLIDLRGAFGVFSGNGECLGLIAAQPLGCGRVWELWECLVHPACRRQGLGSRLLEKMILAFRRRGVESLVCVVSPDHQAALAFLRAKGFRLVAIEPAEQGDGDMFVMRRFIL
jgi:ribosomal protein S18 acetylase RimI-like enzyme